MQKSRILFDKVKELYSLLYWANSFPEFSFFNPNSYQYPHAPFPSVLFAGAKSKMKMSPPHLENLKKFVSEKDYSVGYLSYDLKNELERLTSKNPDFQSFAPIHFFHPKHSIFIGDDALELSEESLSKEIKEALKKDESWVSRNKKIEFRPVISKKKYLQKVELLKQHIIEGDVYELNFCMEFQAENIHIDPIQVYQRLNSISPTPFSVLQKNGAEWLICASPERYMKKKGSLIVSQPIKGTVRRSMDASEDEQLKKALFHSEKERAENMMIVDLVRNDLNKVASRGSVQVSEMFGIYTFPQVHQMISTVEARLSPEFSPLDALREAFPMGSMTGAPKIRAMELIDQYEESKRGLFSGSVGFFSPEGDFDFNVVIRSIFYNSLHQTLSFQVGSAITFDSDPEKEYLECLLKAKAIIQCLDASIAAN